jgi:hypothetical protein
MSRVLAISLVDIPFSNISNISFSLAVICAIGFKLVNAHNVSHRTPQDLVKKKVNSKQVGFSPNWLFQSYLKVGELPFLCKNLYINRALVEIRSAPSAPISCMIN